MAKKNNVVEMYTVHIFHESYREAMTPRMVDMIKRHHGYVTAKSKDPMLFCISIAFRKKKQAKAFFNDCRGFLNAALDLSPSYMKRKYLREEDKND